MVTTLDGHGINVVMFSRPCMIYIIAAKFGVEGNLCNACMQHRIGSLFSAILYRALPLCHQWMGG
jgi:hypothetical protein